MEKIKLQEILAKIRKKINPQELLSRIPEDRNKLIIVIVFALLILYLDFSFVLKSQMRAIGELDPKIIRLKEDLRNLQSDLSKMEKQDIAISANNEGLVKRLISLDEVTWLIEKISHLANQQEVRIFRLNPVSESSKEKSAFILIDLQLYAGYHQLGKFLADLENYPIFLQIEELDTESNEKDPLRQNISLRLKAYLSP